MLIDFNNLNVFHELEINGQEVEDNDTIDFTADNDEGEQETQNEGPAAEENNDNIEDFTDAEFDEGDAAENENPPEDTPAEEELVEDEGGEEPDEDDNIEDFTDAEFDDGDTAEEPTDDTPADEGGDDEVQDFTQEEEPTENTPADEGGEEPAEDEGGDDDIEDFTDAEFDDEEGGEDNGETGTGASAGTAASTSNEGGDDTGNEEGGEGESQGEDAGGSGAGEGYDDGDSVDDGEAGEPQSLSDLENSLFDGLSPQQLAIKNTELLSNYMELYETLCTLFDDVNKIPKTYNNMRVLEYVTGQLSDTRDKVNYTIINTYITRTYVENLTEYKKFLLILYQINTMLKGIIQKPAKESDSK